MLWFLDWRNKIIIMKLDLVKIKSIVFISILFLGFIGCSQNNSIAFEATYPIIPVPNQISFGDAEIKFKSINISTIEFKNEKKLLTNFFKTNDITSLENGLHIQLIKENISVYDNEEAYKISISDSIKRVAKIKSDFFIVYFLNSLVKCNFTDGYLFWVI